MSKFSDLINGDKPVLVDFFAEWCGPCKMMKPILEDLKKDIAERATIIKVDIDKNQQVASAYQIKGVPTFILFKKGKQVWRKSGLQQLNELKSMIESHQ